MSSWRAAGAAPAQGIRHLCGARDGLRLGWDISLEVGVTQQTQPQSLGLDRPMGSGQGWDQDLGPQVGPAQEINGKAGLGGTGDQPCCGTAWVGADGPRGWRGVLGRRQCEESPKCFLAVRAIGDLRALSVTSLGFSPYLKASSDLTLITNVLQGYEAVKNWPGLLCLTGEPTCAGRYRPIVPHTIMRPLLVFQMHTKIMSYCWTNVIKVVFIWVVLLGRCHPLTPKYVWQL